MERMVSQRESLLLGYSPQSQRYLFVNHNNASSPSSSRRSSDIDFSDVFGGPPRRVSFRETRAVDHDDDDDEDDDDNEVSNNEKPVFGDREPEGVYSRSRYANEDFFEDIFKGKDLYSLSCYPRSKNERDSFSSVPGSSVLSPVWPSPPRADQQLGGSSFPAQFSLPSTLINRTELPTFGSPTRSQLKNKDSGSNGSSNYSHSPLSRLSSPASDYQARDVLEPNVSLRTYLSKELSLSSEESLELEKPEARGKTNKLERQPSSSDSDGPQVQGKGGQFHHFSIYKWASKGSPMDMPLRKGKGLGSKEKEKGKLHRCSSFNGWLNGAEMAKRSPRITPGDQSSDTQKDGSRADAGLPRRVEQIHDVEEANLPLRRSESSRSHRVADMKTSMEETEAPKTESKVKSIQKPDAGFDVGEDAKKGSGRSVNADKGDVEKANVGGSERSLGSSIGKNKVVGKVKEFVKIFNQEPAGKPEVNVQSQRQNSWIKEKSEPRKPDATTAKLTGIGMEPNSQRNDKVVDASILVDENPRRSEKQKTQATPDSINSNSSSKHIAASATSLLGSDPDVSEAIFEESDDSSHDDFLFEEILQDEHELAEETSAKSEAEEVKAIDDKIRNWSRGKEGNIRSLLSTLQYVLWPGSGWKTVPLVDIVEGNAVRKPYQKALLCLHPDKLQQKGATPHQKYIAEKVFDILQEAWTHFNSLGSV